MTQSRPHLPASNSAPASVSAAEPLPTVSGRARLWAGHSLPVWITVGVLNLCIVTIAIAVVLFLRSPQRGVPASGDDVAQTPASHPVQPVQHSKPGASSPLLTHADTTWIGKLVVQKRADFKLRIENRFVDAKWVGYYRVDELSGTKVQLNAVNTPLSGWAESDQVIPLDQGVEFFTAQLRANSQDAFSYLMRAIVLFSKNEFDSPMRDLDEAIRINPKFAHAYSYRGIAWEFKKEYDKAIADYTEAIRINPQDTVPFANRGLAWSNKNQFDKAIADFTEAIRLDPNNAAAYCNRGIAWDASKEHDKAIADYNQVLRMNPHSAIAYGNRGVSWEAKEEYDKAIADHTEAIRLDDRNAIYYRSRGDAWGYKKAYDRAIADYDDSIRLDSSQAAVFNSRGLARSYTKDYENAIADFSEAIRLDPRVAEPYRNRADVESANNDFEKAISDYDHAIRISSEDAMAYYGRAYIWSAKKEYKKAIADYGESIRINPKLAWAYCSRGMAWLEQTAYDKAIADFTAAIELKLTDPFVYMNRGDAWSAKKEYDKAISDFVEAIRLDPQNADAVSKRAWLYATCPDAKYRDCKIAIEAATNACELSQWKRADKIDRLAMICALAGEFAAAEMWQSKAIALFADESEMHQYRTRLKIYQDRRSHYEGIRVDPNVPTGQYNTVLVLFLTRQNEEVIGMTTGARFEGQRGDYFSFYALLLGHFAARRMGRHELAKAFLDDAAARCVGTEQPSSDQGAGPNPRPTSRVRRRSNTTVAFDPFPSGYPIVRYLRGDINESNLVAIATASQNLTEAHCYLGLDLVQKQQKEAALSHFRWVKSHGDQKYFEKTLAMAELYWLEGK